MSNPRPHLERLDRIAKRFAEDQERREQEAQARALQAKIPSVCEVRGCEEPAAISGHIGERIVFYCWAHDPGN